MSGCFHPISVGRVFSLAFPNRPLSSSLNGWGTDRAMSGILDTTGQAETRDIAQVFAPIGKGYVYG